jgi:hypothetical protein
LLARAPLALETFRAKQLESDLGVGEIPFSVEILYLCPFHLFQDISAFLYHTFPLRILPGVYHAQRKQSQASKRIDHHQNAFEANSPPLELYAALFETTHD